MDDAYDFGEEVQGINSMSINRCRYCGRIGCEGGTKCRNENGEPL